MNEIFLSSKRIPIFTLSIALIFFTIVLLLEVFSPNGVMLSVIKGSSDRIAPLFMVRDFYLYRLSLSGWTLGFASFIFPNLLIYFLLAFFLSGITAYVLFALLYAVLFVIISRALLLILFDQAIQSKWEVAVFTLIFFAIILLNHTIQDVFLSVEHHGGTYLMSALLLVLTLRYIKKASAALLVIVLTINMLTAASDVLLLTSCSVPLIIAIFMQNFHQRQFDKKHALLIYSLMLSCFIAVLLASYLRLYHFDRHAWLLAGLMIIGFAVLTSPLLRLPQLMLFTNKHYRKLKRLFYSMLVLLMLLCLYAFFSTSVYHFIKTTLGHRLHFSLIGTPFVEFNYWQVMKAMFKQMLFGMPISKTIWFVLNLLGLLFSIGYLTSYQFKYWRNIIPTANGFFVAWFLLASIVLTFTSNLLSVGAHQIAIRYFLIPAFLSGLIITYGLYHALPKKIKIAVIIPIMVLLIIVISPKLSSINFAAYANKNSYNPLVNNERHCLLHYAKRYHLQYGLANHWLSTAVDYYLPNNMFVNQLRINNSKIYRMLNNIYWYGNNPRRHQRPTYNFIVVTLNASTNPSWQRYYGKPTLQINCGHNLALWVYQTPLALMHLNKRIFSQLPN